MNREQIAVFSYLRVKTNIRVVLITSRRGKRWILPKGNLEPGMSKMEVAKMEAYEEAGIIGKITDKATLIKNYEPGLSVLVYPFRIKQLLKKWPEMDERERIIVPVKKAIRQVEHEDLARVIEELSRKLCC